MKTEPRYDVWLLGRAQDGGLPHLGCEKPCCTEARVAGRVEYPCSLGVRDRVTGALLLIEATPAIEPQIASLHAQAGVHGRGRRPVDAVMLTHAHIGHYAGLMQFGEEVANTDHLPVHCTPRMAAFLRGNAPWSQVVEFGQVDLHELAMNERGVAQCEPIAGLRVEAIVVPHRDEHSDTVAFRLQGPHQTLLWVPDVDRWGAHEGLLARLLAGVDVAYVDATFYDGGELPGRDLSRIPHPLMTETMALWADEAMRKPGVVRFLHFNHTNPALHEAKLAAEIEAKGFRIANVGEHTAL